MINVYASKPPLGVKAFIALGEPAVPHCLHHIDFASKVQKSREFLRLNPNGRIPAILDATGPVGATSSVFESGAILWHLAEKFQRLMPAESVERHRLFEYTSCEPLRWHLRRLPALRRGAWPACSMQHQPASQQPPTGVSGCCHSTQPEPEHRRLL